MKSTFYLRGCAEALVEKKSAGIDDATWKLLNRKAVAQIQMVVTDITGLTSGHEVWSKLKTMYESASVVNQNHVMRRIMAARIEGAIVILIWLEMQTQENLFMVTSVLSQGELFHGVHGCIELLHSLPQKLSRGF